MDDGDQKRKNRSRGSRLSTNAFTQAECELLQAALTNKFGFCVTLEKADVTKEGVQRHRLYISARSYDLVRNLIYDKLVPCILYKFPV